MQELRVPEELPLFRLKEEYPNAYNEPFRITNEWFDSELNAKIHAEEWVRRLFGI